LLRRQHVMAKLAQGFHDRARKILVRVKPRHD
jgi:hypothetical protein